jgi:hypothetical protein
MCDYEHPPAAPAPRSTRYREAGPCEGHLCLYGTCEGPGGFHGACGGCCRCTGGCLAAQWMATPRGLAAIQTVDLPEEDERR